MSGSVKPKVSVYIIAYNEEGKIEEALRSATWADEVVVVDSFSTDRTVEIARRYTDRIVQIPFRGFGNLRNEALAHTTHEWIFSLDADERCTTEARDEILAVIRDPTAADAYHVPRRNLFLGRWIRHCDWYPDYRQPQLFRRGALRYREEEVHEGFDVTGRIGYLKSDILQVPFATLAKLIEKMNRYFSLGAEKLAGRGVRGGMGKALAHGVAGFLRVFLLKRGFLDGWPGFVIALSNFESSFYKYAKLRELERKRP